MKLVLTGSIAIDRIMIFPGKFEDVIQPDKLHVLSLSILLDSLKDTRGGVAANIAHTLALLGDHPFLYGSVGSDPWAKQYMKDLKKRGVDTTHVHYSHLPTATFTVMTDKTNCQIGGFYPGAMSDASSLSVKKFAKKNAEKPFVVISPHDPSQMSKQVEECQSLGLRLFYDVGQQISNISADEVRAGVSAAELLILNDYEVGVLTEKTGWTEKEITGKVKILVVTLGKEGCHIIEHGKKKQVPAAYVENVLDPTGAGDAFRAGFLYGYLRGEKAEVCAEYGMVTSAFAIEHHGTQSHTFTFNDFRLRYEENYGKTKPKKIKK
jgi:adenosine kinase